MTDTAPEPSVADLLSLAGRRAVVTGAARGIGAAIARRLAEAGAAVLLGDIDEAGAAAVAGELDRSVAGPVRASAVDVTDSGSVRGLAEWCCAELGGLDVWVNNAGILSATGPIDDAPDDLFDRIHTVNLRGAFLGCREAARRMTAGGVIVNLSSTTAIRAAPAASAYISSKSGIVGLTRSLAVELGPRGIRVVAVAPGFVATPGAREVMEPYARDGVDLAALAAQNPLRRAGTDDDVARVVLFCVSDLAAHVTGALIPVDGGSTA